MDELEQSLGSGTVNFLGPYAYQDVVVEGRLVPHLEAMPQPGGLVHLSVDRRYGLDLTLQEAERVIPFIAHCIAVGMGFVGFPEEENDPVRAQPMPRAHRITL